MTTNDPTPAPDLIEDGMPYDYEPMDPPDDLLNEDRA